MFLLRAALLVAFLLAWGTARSQQEVLAPPPPDTVVQEVQTTVANPEPEKVEETVEQIFERVSKEYSADLRAIARVIVDAESKFQNVCNKEFGCIAGIGPFQIVQSTFDENCEGDAYNAEDNIRCGFVMLEDGEYWRWSPSAKVWLPKLPKETVPMACSCIKTARSLGANIPYGTYAADLVPNTELKQGVVALFRYSGVSHAAMVTEVLADGFWIYEGNYQRCRFSERFIPLTDPALIGFWIS